MDTALLEEKAIEAAIQGAWQKAIDLNNKILKKNVKNIPALNRLARACWETGNLASTKKIYQKVLKFDQCNPIATKNLKRLANRGKSSTAKSKKLPSSEVFLEEPRKTKLVQVIRLTSPQRLAEIDSGDEVFLVPKKRFITVANQNDVHLGSLPEDLSQRLIPLIRGGNHYKAFVKKVEYNKLEILIREISRSQRFKNLPSF
ncbi:MAG TPA: hypothetical protein VMX76_02870 [Nevskiaceae bacterium]|nr:hypothetical protein [Nevskiaceae bacterium]